MSGYVGLNSERVRRDNLSAVLREVHRRGAISRSELAQHTGLYRQTIRSLVGDLVARGLVLEESTAAEGMPGRPSLVVEASTAHVRALAIDIEVDSLGIAIVGLGGKILRSERIDRSRDLAAPEEAVATLVAEVHDFLGQEDLTTIRTAGAAIVGTVRRSDGFLRMAPNLGWRDVPLGDLLREHLDLPIPVVVGNEADLGGLAEHLRGAAAGLADMVYLSGEVGLGGGAVVGGRELVGSGGYAGEIGHVVVNPDGLPCGCGSTGCWETEVGEAALLRHAGVSGDGPRDVMVSRVVTAALRGDPEAVAAAAAIGRWIGIGLAGIVNVFNPEVVVFGGLLQRLYPLVVPVASAELERRVTPALLDGLQIRPSRLGPSAPLVGAAELAFERILADPLALPEIEPVPAPA